MKILGNIKRRILWIYDRQWDYKYLNNCLKQSRKERIKTICIGSSYTAFGVDPDDSCVNMALPSQDIYYATELIKKYLDSSSSINSIIMGMGYYSLYTDLSRTKSFDENDRIYDVYYPILKDLHNMSDSVFLETKRRYGNVNKLIRYVINFTFLHGHPRKYFNCSSHTRDRRALKTWKDISLAWNELSESERFFAAQSRVMAHEKQFNYVDSERENRKILCELSELCKSRDIKFYIYISPMTNEYIAAMSNYYVRKKKELCDFLKEVADRFIDFNSKEYVFEHKDFVDTDHLSDSGASKLSGYIQKFFSK